MNIFLQNKAIVRSAIFGVLLGCSFFANAAEQPSVSLQKAYEREFAFLAAQSKILNERLREMDEKFNTDQDKIQKEIDSLEDKLLARRNKSERLELTLRETERTLDERKSDKTFFENTINQSKNTLEKFNSALFDGEFETAGDQDKLASIFTSADNVLSRLSQVTKQQGEFFLADGTKTSGDIIKVGNIAAYGLSNTASGALAPAGDGMFKLWPEPTSESAKALDAGSAADSLKLFLFESTEKDITPQKDKTAIEVIQSGGAVAWVIVALGVLAVALCIVRIVLLKRASSSTDQLTHEVADLINRDKVDSAVELCKKTRGSIARVLTATIRNLDRSRDHLEDIISENILHENSALDRFGMFILVIAAVSPLLGLLGTVTGMIATFDIITEFGTGDPKLLSGGISVALVTTELGLIVAIPILLIGNVLSGWSEKIKHDMERSALRITNVYENRQLANADNVQRVA